MSAAELEYKARYRKSMALARALKELRVTAAEVPALTQEQWQMAADAATVEMQMRGDPKPKIHPPHSEATKLTIMGILENGH